MEKIKIKVSGIKELRELVCSALVELGYEMGSWHADPIGYGAADHKWIFTNRYSEVHSCLDTESDLELRFECREVSLDDLFEMLREKRAQPEEKVLTPEQIREKFGIKSGTRVQISGIDVVI